MQLLEGRAAGVFIDSLAAQADAVSHLRRLTRHVGLLTSAHRTIMPQLARGATLPQALLQGTTDTVTSVTL